jgi:hypothetical protein
LSGAQAGQGVCQLSWKCNGLERISRRCIVEIEMNELPSLLKTLRAGTPGERWQAARDLPEFGEDAEAPIVGLMLNAADPREAGFYLNVLSGFRLSFSASVDAIVQRLAQANTRYAAAYCLLLTSPKLRRHLPLIRAIYERESDERRRQILKKLLDRYPKDAT